MSKVIFKRKRYELIRNSICCKIASFACSNIIYQLNKLKQNCVYSSY